MGIVTWPDPSGNQARDLGLIYARYIGVFFVVGGGVFVLEEWCALIFCRSVVLRSWMELCVNLWSLDLSWGRKRMASYGVVFCCVCFDYTLGFLSMGFPVLLESRVTQCISRVSIFTSAMKNFAYESCFIFNIWNKT